jgi:hypothetical protein
LAGDTRPRAILDLPGRARTGNRQPVKLFGTALCLLAVAQAPLQCGSGADPEGPDRIEETPGEALYGLAEKFKAQGDEAARKQTLEYLIDRYPTSRFAARARQDLGIAPSEKAP